MGKVVITGVINMVEGVILLRISIETIVFVILATDMIIIMLDIRTPSVVIKP